MTPIVDGLETQYENTVTFMRLNALDNDIGQRAFEMLNLPGHPSFVLLTPDGVEVWRGFGQQTADSLAATIDSVLGDR